jgi:hypothetical protein
MRKENLQAPLYRVLNPQGKPGIGRDTSAVPKNDSGASQGQFNAPRLGAVDGKTIYLVDVGFGGGYEFLKEMEGWFSRNMPAVTTVLTRKKGNMFMDDPALWTEIKAKGHAAVLGVGG